MNSLKQYFLRFGDFQKNARLFIYLSFILGVSQNLFGLVYNLYILKLGYTREFLGTLESIPVFVTAALAVPLALLCVNLPLKKTSLSRWAWPRFPHWVLPSSLQKPC